MTKSIIKNFSYKCLEDKLWKVDYIDVKSNLILTGKAKEVGSVAGFYSDEMEGFLNNHIENDMGPILKNIKDFEKLDNFTLSPKDRVVIKRYFNFLFYRSEYLIKKVNERTWVSKVFGNIPREYIFSQENELDELKVFNNYYINLMLNTSNTQLVVPRNGFYFYNPIGDPSRFTFILPISPYKAIILLDRQEYQKFIFDDILRPMHISDNNSIEQLNKFAYKIEKELNKKMIIGRRKELESLVASVANFT